MGRGSEEEGDKRTVAGSARKNLRLRKKKSDWCRWLNLWTDHPTYIVLCVSLIITVRQDKRPEFCPERTMILLVRVFIFVSQLFFWLSELTQTLLTLEIDQFFET